MKTISFLLFLSLSAHAFSCSCAYWDQNFCQSVSPSTHIALVTVVDKGIVIQGPYAAQFVDVKLLKNIHNTIQEDTLRIWGQDGLNCGEMVAGLFEVNDTIIVGLNAYKATGFLFGDFLDNYSGLSICNREYLEVSNNEVSGPIAPGVTNLPFDEFVTNLKSCLGLSGYGMTIYPNPAKDVINVYIQDGYPNPHQVYIVSSDGKICRSTASSFDSAVSIDIANLTAGIYFVEAVTFEGIVQREKFLKE